MNRLKGIIFSREGVFENQGVFCNSVLEESIKLLRHLISMEIQPILISDNTWSIPLVDGTSVAYQKYLSDACGINIRYYQEGVDIESKHFGASMKKILADQNWKSSEVMYVGNTRGDMMAATNGGLLFMNATWYGTNSPHGHIFSKPKNIGRFIECCCVIPQDWFWKVEQDDLRVYSIAPLAENSKLYPEGEVYSGDAKSAVKHDTGQTDFWGMLMAARLHLSGFLTEAKYVVPYPGHSAGIGYNDTILMNAVKTISLTKRDQYLCDFIVRHSNALKSQSLRNVNRKPTIQSQLNTIRLNEHPTRHGAKHEKYKNARWRGKTIIVVDDICTEGHSFEAARAFLEAEKAKAILISWLKTPGKDYHAIGSLHSVISDPFQGYTYQGHVPQLHAFRENVANELAAKQIGDAYARYINWNWPNGI